MGSLADEPSGLAGSLESGSPSDATISRTSLQSQSAAVRAGGGGGAPCVMSLPSRSVSTTTAQKNARFVMSPLGVLDRGGRSLSLSLSGMTLRGELYAMMAGEEERAQSRANAQTPTFSNFVSYHGTEPVSRDLGLDDTG